MVLGYFNRGPKNRVQQVIKGFLLLVISGFIWVLVSESLRELRGKSKPFILLSLLGAAPCRGVSSGRTDKWELGNRISLYQKSGSGSFVLKRFMLGQCVNLFHIPNVFLVLAT